MSSSSWPASNEIPARDHPSSIELPLLSDGRVPRLLLLIAALLVALLYLLLWSPWWYPLSDSSLYLIMARNLANGEGIRSLSMVHRSVRPLTPIVLWLVVRAGGGIGAMHGVMIALILLAHLMSFLTLRRWFNERIALAATVATAASWWVFCNAFCIMTEPLFLVMWWGCALALSRVPAAPPRRRWVLVIVAALCLAGAWGNRMAAALLLPGVLIGIWFGFRATVPARLRAAWVGLFVLVFAILIGIYLHKGRAETGEKGSLVADAGDSDRRAATEVYKWNVLVGVSSPLVQLPVMGGRWVLESLAAGFSVPFSSKSRIVQACAGVGAILTFLLAVTGWARLIRQRHWWAVGMALYFLPFWVMWGTRVKPRYMVPIIPLLFILLWQGVAVVGSLPFRRRFGQPRAFAAASRIAVWVLVLGGVLLNAIPWGIEFYLRHGSSHNFYDEARRGGFAELVDIAAYLEHHAARDQDLWTNKGAYRRIIGFLADHDPKTIRGDVAINNPADTAHLHRYFERVNKGNGHYALVFYDALPWPLFHWPLPTDQELGTSPRWWQLYEKDDSGSFVLVTVPHDRRSVEKIPGVHR